MYDNVWKHLWNRIWLTKLLFSSLKKLLWHPLETEEYICLYTEHTTAQKVIHSRKTYAILAITRDTKLSTQNLFLENQSLGNKYQPTQWIKLSVQAKTTQQRSWSQLVDVAFTELPVVGRNSVIFLIVHRLNNCCDYMVSSSCLGWRKN